jgi:reactive intermediate/imine deaminase
MTTLEQVHSNTAPQAIGPYSQAIKAGSIVFLSGQIPLNPETMELVSDDVAAQTHQVFKNLIAVAEAAGGGLALLWIFAEIISRRRITFLLSSQQTR